ncbi:MAG: hypothetical protein YFSK_1440 [Candidatus Yanofskyibacterium parasiticum]|jgi:hypothetical protein|nr:MAG: hypothetical protein YFSK_1440 [Candidatus Yanofskybacteria bacterium]
MSNIKTKIQFQIGIEFLALHLFTSHYEIGLVMGIIESTFTKFYNK